MMATQIQIADPEVVYHYTSADTLLKIVRSEEIWATSIFYLNDVSEISHSLKLLTNRLPAFLERNKPERGEVLRSAFAQGISIDGDPPFVASFSSQHDSLPQWRSYCSNGNGVSMGFRVSSLRQSSLTHELFLGRFSPSSSKLNRVTYIGEGDDFRVDLILQKCLNELIEWNGSQAALPDDERTIISDEEFLRYTLAEKLCSVKHRSFESESEYRLIAPREPFIKTDTMKFRSSRSTIIPYMSVLMPKWSKSQSGQKSGSEISPEASSYFLKDVVVGPTPTPSLTIASLRLLFDRLGVDVDVRGSDVPFRDL
jgi:hypothetical protein